MPYPAQQGGPKQDPGVPEGSEVAVHPKAGYVHQALVLLSFPRLVCNQEDLEETKGNEAHPGWRKEKAG